MDLTTETILKVFADRDDENSGTVDYEIFKELLQAVNANVFTDQKLEEMLLASGQNCSGKVKYGPFFEWANGETSVELQPELARIKTTNLSPGQVNFSAERLAGVSRSLVLHLFNEVDRDLDGAIGFDDLDFLAAHFGEKWDDDFKREVFNETADAELRAITFDGFYHWIVRSCRISDSRGFSTRLMERRAEKLNIGADRIPRDLRKLLDEFDVSSHKQKVTHPLHDAFGRMLVDHLMSCYLILEEWGNPPEVCKCGLFHAVYQRGDGFRAMDFSVARPKLQSSIGKDAEELVYFYPSAHKSIFDPDGLNHAPIGGDLVIEDVLTKQSVTLPARLRAPLAEVEFVNSHDQAHIDDDDAVHNLWSYYMHVTILPLLSKGAQEVILRYRTLGARACCADIVRWHEARFAAAGTALDAPNLAPKERRWKKHLSLFCPGGKYAEIEALERHVLANWPAASSPQDRQTALEEMFRSFAQSSPTCDTKAAAKLAVAADDASTGVVLAVRSMATNMRSSVVSIAPSVLVTSPGFKMAVGVSVGGDTLDCVAFAADAVRTELRGLSPHWLICGVAPGLSELQLLPALREHFPGVKIHAVSSCGGGAGVLGSCGRGQLGILAIVDPKGHYEVASAMLDSEIEAKISRCITDMLSKATRKDKPSLVLMTAPPATEEAILNSLRNILPDVPILGGSAASEDPLDFGWWTAAFDTELQLGGNQVVFTLMWPSVPVSMRFESSYVPTDRAAVVVALSPPGASSSREVLTLDAGQGPELAARVYSRLSQIPALQAKLHKIKRPLQVLSDTGFQPLGRRVGDIVQLLHPAAITKDDGLTLFAEVSVAEKLEQMCVDGAGLLSFDVPTDAQACSGVLLVFCAGSALAAVADRKDGLDIAASRLSAQLGNVPFMSLLSFGEQCTTGGVAAHANLMRAWLMFGASSS